MLGIASFVLCLACTTGIPGLVLGIIGVNKISNSGGALKEKGIAITGLVLSAVGILWTTGGGGNWLSGVQSDDHQRPAHEVRDEPEHDFQELPPLRKRP